MKQDFVSSKWHRTRNRFGNLMDDASFYNTDDRSYMWNGGGKYDYKLLQMCTKKNLT